MNPENVFFLVFLATVLVTRIYLYFWPIPSPTIRGFRLHHYMYGIINYFDCQLTNEQSEGFNNKINIIKRRAYGYRDLDYFKLKIIQSCGLESSK